ncbi:3-oxoacyl-[acyl-carrier-protein] synthase III C-terminal domain-containing protein [Yinghuangia aomiensis]|uniref:3-oxoacyl-[acyl-carrier-protein] synthase III C-terminal domain-containing protein n=1 Tax=Yinghuangia aomiensis TaxID=676205 RepID=A0ABP9HTZ4_9ACTN
MTRLVARGTYVPRHRLDRASVGIGHGTRSVASYDEDTTSMGVAAARRALQGATPRVPGSVIFSTSTPAYTDRTNATAIAEALGLRTHVGAYDFNGSVRSAVGGFHAAADAAAAGRTAMLVAADIRTGLPGSSEERDGGDGAAALVFAPDGPCLAEVIATSAVSTEFLDRWRPPGAPVSHVWEERFGESVYVPLAAEALGQALVSAGLEPGDVHHLIVAGLHRRAVAGMGKAAGVRSGVLVDDRSDAIGVAGAAHAFLMLCDVLERAVPTENIVVLVLADGADCVVLRAGELAGAPLPGPTVADAVCGPPVGHHDMLVWRGLLRREPPRRPDPDRPAAPPSHRGAAWKFGFTGTRCVECGTRHLPPQRVCHRCRAVDRMQSEGLAGLTGTVSTFTVDHLAFSVAPPVVVVVVDLDGGGRLQCELTDADHRDVRVGDRVELTFRRLYTTTDGVHDYFWKVRPLLDEESA